MIVYHTNQGHPLNLFTSLLEITRRDTQFGEEILNDALFLNQFLYTAPTDLDGFGRPFIAKLTATNTIVYVRAVGGDFTLDDGTPISEVFGITIPDGKLETAEGEEVPAIVIYYDYTNGNGEGYALFDENGEEICLPSFVLLGHELSHASHMIDGDHPEDAAEAHEQVIIPEENLIREEHGLPLRDPANDGGVTPSAVCASSMDAGGSSSCFVLTAALGMERHDPIAALHALRRRLLGPTRFAALFYAAFRREYYSFAPTLADDVRVDARLRRAIRQAVIEPFLGWAETLDGYLAGRSGGGGMRQHSLDWPEDPAAVAGALGRLAAWLRGERQEPAAPPSGSVAGVALDELLTFLAANIAGGCGTAPYTAWAVLEPARLCLEASVPSSRLDVDAAVEQWIGAIPIPDRVFALSPGAFGRELDTASRHGLFSGAAGVALAARIEEGFRVRRRTEQVELVREQCTAAGCRSWRS